LEKFTLSIARHSGFLNIFNFIISTKFNTKFQILIISEESPKTLLCLVSQVFGLVLFPTSASQQIALSLLYF
jgi:hypothetical protein